MFASLLYFKKVNQFCWTKFTEKHKWASVNFFFPAQYGLIAFSPQVLPLCSPFLSGIRNNNWDYWGKKKMAFFQKRKWTSTQFLDSKGLQRRIISASFGHLTATILLLKDVILNLLQHTNENPAFSSFMFVMRERGRGWGEERKNFYSVYVISLNVNNCCSFAFENVIIASTAYGF